MYLSIIFLPILASILSGLFGRALGVKGVYTINITCLLITTLLSFVAFYEVVLCNSPVSIELFTWINIDPLYVTWSFYYDELTVSMLIPVLIVSLLVHIYSVGYMGEDPHQQRFFSYISLFTGLMLILVTGNNFLVMFLGWEGVGVCSYLLVHFWYTRVAAVKSAMSAMFTNRVGDFFLTIGFFAIFFTFGTLDYATVFSLAPYINTNVITYISILLLLGAAAKSAQLGLHIWLPQAMEGSWYYWIIQKIYNHFIIFIASTIYSFHWQSNEEKGSSSGRNLRVNSSPDQRPGARYNTSTIRVYDVINKSLVKGSPFYTKTDWANTLNISRGTVRSYLDSNKIYKHKWVFSSTTLLEKEFLKWEVSQKILDIITGELLGDGHINYDPEHAPHIHGRLQFTFSAKNLPYLNYLKFVALAPICRNSEPTPWPNFEKTNIKPTQYWFGSKQLPFLSKLHLLWYINVKGKRKKILPKNIEEMLTPISIAHWIMGDGYFEYNKTIICTDNFL